MVSVCFVLYYHSPIRQPAEPDTVKEETFVSYDSMKLTLTKNAIFQAAAVAGHVGVQTSAAVTDQIQTWATIAITIGQAVIAILAHFRKPSGAKINQLEPQQPPVR